MKKDLSYYMALPYSKVVKFQSDESGQYFVSEVLELSGCSSTGDTETEALDSLKEAMACYLECCLADGDAIPEPADTEGFNGKLVNSNVTQNDSLSLILPIISPGSPLNSALPITKSLTPSGKSSAISFSLMPPST